ncbi:MAG TPA: DNA mismatch repair endonuclease MutL [Candidatus Saccharicenans sp.]|nr:DNA mismatch repair endonuclease MutL [Candidatus Saccharicenans sp.]HOM94248.1 DNA mismatch repair endonuclease MutL [Candidatus Saccharicenans sp.]HQE64385.1 DNA mismatch repair endonuclease MutL [Candidatus Saccharicenans sp.]HQI22439.1 DNA mismatch repair endonuclease MutL [Candidatus Saccharicenans sp.]
MARIKVLPAEVAQKIAAGEVVERPVSVVKELIENSLDAGATEIKIELEEGGKKLIRLQDNGCGLSQEDAVLCFKRHATSKLEKEEDLEHIATLGFRGEALASISAVSRLTLKTYNGEGDRGYQVEREGDRLIRFLEIAFPRGTMVEVRDLFFNLPARRKFLRGERSELNLITSYVTQAALAFPGVKFILVHNGRQLLNCPAVSTLEERVYQLYGRQLLDGLMAVDYEEGGYRLSGLSSRPFAGRADRQHQLFFVNRRPIKDRVLGAALTQAYLGMLDRQKSPECFLFLDLPYELVDVNVHPAKAEIRFKEPQAVFGLILRAIELAARSESLIKPVMIGEAGRGEKRQPSKETSQPELNLQEKEEQKENDRGIEKELGEKIQAPEWAGQASQTWRQPGETQQVAESTATPRAGRHILGQYLNAYLVVTAEEGLMIVDQHNAHERILFEKFKKLDEEKGWASRQMLFPQVLELSPEEVLHLEELQEELAGLGFELESLGERSYSLRAFPDVFDEARATEILRGILAEGGPERLKSKRDRMLATMACKAAIKAGQPLSQAEMEFLAAELFQTSQPGVCPHGRPIIVEISRDKIEKTLGRQPGRTG